MILSLGLNDFVDKPVCKSFVGGHIVVALGVKFNAGNGLAGARGKYSIQLFANAQDLFGMNLNIRCLPLCVTVCPGKGIKVYTACATLKTGF